MINKMFFLMVVFILNLFWGECRKKRSSLSGFAEIAIILILSIVYAYREIFLPELMENAGDYYVYEEWFHYISFQNLKFHINNIGFDLLISVVKLFTHNYHMFLLVCGIMIHSLMYKFIGDHSEYEAYSAMIYVSLYYFSAFNIMRQWIAAAIFWAACTHIINRNFWKYSICIVMAASFHPSAIFLIALYPIISVKMSYTKKILAIATASLLGFMEFNHLVNTALQLSSRLGFNYLEKYERIRSGFETSNMVPVIILMLMAAVITFLYFYSELKEREIDYAVMNAMAAGCALLSTTNFIFNRMLVYLFPIMIVTLPLVLKIISKEDGSKRLFMIGTGAVLALKFVI